MNDIIPDEYATHTINILRVAAGLRAKALSALLTLEGTLAGKVLTANSLNQKARLSALLKQTQGSIAKTYDVIAKGHGKDLADIAALEGKVARRIIGKAIGADILTVATSANQLAAVSDTPTLLGHSTASWWGKQSTDLQHAFAGQMQQGILTGESNDKLVQRIRGTKANAYNDGIMATSRRQATTLVRSSAISTANSARLKTLGDMNELVSSIQWLATFDNRTSLICIGLSGLTWTLPDYEPIGHSKAFPGATAHVGCRSSQVPVLKSWDEIAGKKLPVLNDQEIEERMKKKLAAAGMSQAQLEKVVVNSRASMDGAVHKNLTFTDWLKTKSDPVIDTLLGPGRAALWNRGRGAVSLADLTNQDNRPVTIRQLEELVGTGTPLPETQGVSYFTLDPDGEFKEFPAAGRESLASAIPDRDLEEIATAWARDGEIRNGGLKSLYGSLTPTEKSLVATRRLELEAPVPAPLPARPPVATAVLTRPDVLPVAPPRSSPVSASIKGDIPANIAGSIGYAMNAIDRVHDDGKLPKMVVVSERPLGVRKTDRGAYTRNGYDGESVYIDPDSPHQEFTGVHEYGHFLHHQVLDDPEVWGHLGAASGPMAKLRKALNGTDQVKELKKMAKAQKSAVIIDWKYYSDEREIFARAYSQWVATRLNDPILRAALESDKLAINGRFIHWPDEEFGPIAAAFEAVFSAKGWL